MKVGGHVYLITDPLQTGAGIPGMIYKGLDIFYYIGRVFDVPSDD